MPVSGRARVEYLRASAQPVRRPNRVTRPDGDRAAAKCNLVEPGNRTLREFALEVLFLTWDEKPYAGISVQGYDSREDVGMHICALTELLPEVGGRAEKGAATNHCEGTTPAAMWLWARDHNHAPYRESLIRHGSRCRMM